MSRRTSEIGLRVALGASGRNILGMTIGQGMRPVLLGVALGAMGAFWLSRYMMALLFGIKPFDLQTYFAVAILLLATALLALLLTGAAARCALTQRWRCELSKRVSYPPPGCSSFLILAK